MQEHPGTGRTLDHKPTNQVKIEDVAKAIGVENVVVTERVSDFQKEILPALENGKTNLIVMRKTCALAKKKIEKLEEKQLEGEICDAKS